MTTAQDAFGQYKILPDNDKQRFRDLFLLISWA